MCEALVEGVAVVTTRSRTARLQETYVCLGAPARACFDEHGHALWFSPERKALPEKVAR